MKRPNVIIINCDDLGYGDLGCFGSELNDTPYVDKMASEGVRLTDFYSASPVCSPSRAALLTGCYPKRIGFDLFDEGNWVLFPGFSTGLHEEETTIASLLQANGYATAIVGKWHCGDQAPFLPTNRGFDTYFGIPYSNDMGRQKVASSVDFPPLPLMLDDEVIQLQPNQRGLTERYVEHSLRFIRDNRDRPFFLYLAHMHVHLPLYVSQPFLDQSRNGAYGGAVACIDWALGAIRYELKQLGLEEQTIIVFTSDNGARGDYGGSNGPLRGRKTTTWEGGMRVPCIVAWPGTIPEGGTCSHITTAMDLLPTIASWTSSELPGERAIDGKDVSGLLAGQSGAPVHDAFYYYAADALEAVRSGSWKLHVAKGQRDMLALYDLSQDLGETTDVSASHPEVVARLQAKLNAARLELGDGRTGAVGTGCREPGRVENPTVLTVDDVEQYPFIAAEYDLPDRG